MLSVGKLLDESCNHIEIMKSRNFEFCGLCFHNDLERFLTATSQACCSIQQSIKETRRWPAAIESAMPYSGLAVRQGTEGAEVVTVGEDGFIKRFILKDPRDTPAQSIESGADSLTCVAYLGQNEVAVGNLAGRLKIFDLNKSQEVRACLL